MIEQSDAGLSAASLQRVKLPCRGGVQDRQIAVLGGDRVVHHGECQVGTADLAASRFESRKCLWRRGFVDQVAVDID